MRPPGPTVILVVFVVFAGKPADVLIAIISGITIDMDTLANFPI